MSTPRGEDVPSSNRSRIFPAPAAPVPVVVGVDMVERARFVETCERFGERFLGRVFTPAERALVGTHVTRLAGRFAAKEACSKALGTGIGAVAWREIEILRLESGKPVLQLSGNALVQAERLGLGAFDVSISDTHDHALAMVVGLRG